VRGKIYCLCSLRKEKKMKVSTYISERLKAYCVERFFTVAGDYIMPLLDELGKPENLKMVCCCSELGASYAADGYARERGDIGCLVVTYGVGALSTVNGIAGAFAEDVPLLLIVGIPFLDTIGRLVHHAVSSDFSQTHIFENITAAQYTCHSVSSIPEKFESALKRCKAKNKPVLFEISSHLFSRDIRCYAMGDGRHLQTKSEMNPTVVQAGDSIVEHIRASIRPVIILGGLLNRNHNLVACIEVISKRTGIPVCCMCDAKGLYNEEDPNFIGTHWGSASLSSPYVESVVNESDLQMVFGPRFSDFTTSAYNLLIVPNKMIICYPYHIEMFGVSHLCVDMLNLVEYLKVRETLPIRSALLADYNRLSEVDKNANEDKDEDKLTRPFDTFKASPIANKTKEVCNDKRFMRFKRSLSLKEVQKHVQALLARGPVCYLVDTGDALFWSQRLKLCKGSSYHNQMQYASIGWSTGAVLGAALANQDNYRRDNKNGEKVDGSTEPIKRVIGVIGDGALQMTVSEISDLIRYKVHATIICINNDGYAVEAKIHDGVYNRLQNWNYADLVACFNGESGKGVGVRVATEEELAVAVDEAEKHPYLTFIEVVIPRDDVSAQLMDFGPRLAAFTNRAC